MPLFRLASDDIFLSVFAPPRKTTESQSLHENFAWWILLAMFLGAKTRPCIIPDLQLRGGYLLSISYLKSPKKSFVGSPFVFLIVILTIQ